MPIFRLVTRRLRPFIVAVTDAEGVRHEYVFKAKSRRHATHRARAWVRRLEWDATLVEVTPMVNIDREYALKAKSRRHATRRSGARGRRLLAVAGVTFAVSGITIAATMILALSLEGAL